MAKPTYDTTLARIAGNIAGGLMSRETLLNANQIAINSVRIARAIVARVIDTEPAEEPGSNVSVLKGQIAALTVERDALAAWKQQRENTYRGPVDFGRAGG